MASKNEALAALRTEMEADMSLPLRESNLVFGEGSADGGILFIGEAPGFHEDRLGRPFVGQAGQLLDRLIEEVGWKRSNVYITNIVKRRPPGNRDPLPEEIDAYKSYLARQIDIIHPKVIATLGRFAMNYFLPEARIMRDQNRVFEVGSLRIFPLLHPAAALRATEMRRQLEEGFKKLAGYVESLSGESVSDVSSAPHAESHAEETQHALF